MVPNVGIGGCVIPEVRLPFGGGRHLQVGVAGRLSEGWGLRFGLTLSGGRAGSASGLWGAVCPGVALHGLALVANWCRYLCVVDEQRVAEDGVLVGALRQVVADDSVSTARNGHPGVLALRELLRSTVLGCPAYWVRRLRGHLDRWLSGQLAESAYRVSGRVPTPEAFIDVRRDASAVLVMLDLVEMVERAAVLDVLYRAPAYQMLVLGTADLVCWIDDLHSLRKGDPMNLVTVLERHQQLGPQEAVDAVGARIALRAADQLAAGNQLPAAMARLGFEPVCRPAVMRCVADQQSWVAGMGTASELMWWRWRRFRLWWGGGRLRGFGCLGCRWRGCRTRSCPSRRFSGLCW